MRIVMTILFVLSASFAAAQDRGADIRDVISRQLEAFEADDFEAAHELASPFIQDKFGTVENFGQMVRDAYPVVHRHGRVDFGGLEDVGGRLVQRVYTTDAGGRLFELQYEMIQTEDGWKINGVQVLQAKSVGA